MTIIKAGIEYANILTEIGAETFIDAHGITAPKYEIDAYVNRVYNTDAIKAELLKEENIYHVIELENKLAGFSKMEFDMKNPFVSFPHASKMDQIYLLKPFQGLKLGAKLLLHNIAYSKANNQNGMWLVVWIKNQQAIRFYNNFGFKIVGESNFSLTATHANPCYIMALNYHKP